VLSLDAMDVSGEHELDVVHDVYKRKVNKDGLPYGEVQFHFSPPAIANNPHAETEASFRPRTLG
jgi:hypothetical protein